MEMKGLVVEFDGKINRVWYHGITEYPIGEMAAEYARVHPSDLKDIILAYSKIDVDTDEDALCEFFPWFADRLCEEYGVATAVIITTEFLDITAGFRTMNPTMRNEQFNEIEPDDEIKKFIFDGFDFDMGIETLKQTLLTTYYWYAQSYVAFKHSFNMLATEEEYEEEQVNAFWSMFAENIDLQHIDFQLFCDKGRFGSLYTIKTSLSLILFEATHYLDSENHYVKCANCGNYFIPRGRNDAIYCQYKSPQNPEKTCREIGAQITRANKEKNDVTTKEYRKQYMRLKMLATRHPEKLSVKKSLEQLTTDAIEWRSKLKNGTCTTDDFLTWVKDYDKVQ